MATKGRKQVKGKWNFLLMRPQGQVTNFAVSPLFLAVALLFALAFTIGSVVIANKYFELYLDYQEAAESRREMLDRLNQFEGQYKYRTALAQDYAELLKELDLPLAEAGGTLQAAPEAAEEAPPASAVPDDPLEAWAARLPDLDLDNSLRIESFRAEGNRFSFQLINRAPGSLARGRLLTLFLVETEGRRQAVPFPDFDLQSDRPDFEPGPGYNIRNSKSISGQLAVPPGSSILGMMAVAQSSDGRIVMKRRINP